MSEFALVNRLQNPTLLVPDIEYISKFVKGDMGIGDKINKSSKISTIQSINNIDVLEQYLDANGITTNKDLDSFISDGKIEFSESDLNINTPDFTGVKSLEKTLLQSIFETQKPYMEIIKLITDNLVTIEDIIAVILAIGGPSLNPIYNPKALGYKDANPTIDQNLDQLQTICDYVESNTLSTNNSNNNDIVGSTTNNYEVISTEYSTGVYNPSYEYEYRYIDIIDNLSTPINNNLPYDNPPYIDDLPNTIIIGIFDSDGNPITILDDWLVNSGKWYGQFDQVDVNPSKQELIDYYKDYLLSTNTDSSLTSEQKIKSIDDAISNMDMDEISKVVYGDSYLKNIFDNGVNHPLYQLTFKPKKINIDGKEIWIEPETDYDLKVIRLVNTFSPTDILNVQLKTNERYSSGYYGYPDSDNSQNIQNVVYYTTDIKSEVFTPLDFYIVEGVLSDDEVNSKNSNGKKRGKKYYKRRDYLKVPSKFAKILSNIFAKLIPAITDLLTLLTNPIDFIIQILLKKLGDNNGTENIKFLMFSKPFIDEYAQLKNISTNEEKSNFIENSSYIKNYVALYPNGSYRFIMNGATLYSLFNLVFGINIQFPKFDTIISKAGTSNTNSDSDSDSNSNLNSNDISLNNQNIDITNTISDIRTKTTETVDTWYSTGVYDSSYDYDYIYVTEYVSNLIMSANNILSKYEINNFVDTDPFKYIENIYEDDIEEAKVYDLQIAGALLEEGLRNDKDNTYLKSMLSNVKKIIGSSYNNPILKFIFNLVGMPLKLVKEIIEYVLNFFKSLTNPFTLPSKITEFISFKWFFEFFNPSKILELVGIKFDLKLFSKWKEYIKSSSFETENFINNTEKTYTNFDLQDVIDLTVFTRMFEVSPTQLENISNLPLKMLKGILNLLQEIINSIIEFFWALLGLKSIKDVPKINLIKDISGGLSDTDISDIINDNFTDINDYDDIISDNIKSYLYDISLSDGTKLTNLNNEQLKNWILNNKDLFKIEYDI